MLHLRSGILAEAISMIFVFENCFYAVRTKSLIKAMIIQSHTYIISNDYKKLSHQRCSIIKCVLRKFARFTEKHLCQRLFFNKVAGLSPVNRTSGF